MKFCQRFDIKIDLDEAKKRFVNRARNRIFSKIYYELAEKKRIAIRTEIASSIGVKDSDLEMTLAHGYTSFLRHLSDLIGDNFYKNLQALETFYQETEGLVKKRVEENIIQSLLESEVALGVHWENGRFLKSGAKLLDDTLVNDPLHWLRDNKYYSVIEPFEKGLYHFLHSEKQPELLSDVITDMYEAIESLSKIITDRPNKDLSANLELFISKVKASSKYKKVFKEYITYANEFRHGKAEGRAKPAISQKEVESFVYLTGLFIRLAVP